MNNNDLLRVPAYFHREYENDLPKQETKTDYTSQALRVAKVGLPFVALYQPFGKALACGLGATRTISTLSECFAAEDFQQLSWAMFNTCLAAGSVAGTIFLHPLGMLITTLSDIGMNVYHVYGAISRGEMLEAGKQTMRVANNSFYLAMMVTGSIELQLASLVVQVLVEGSSSYEEFNKDNWLETLGHLGMTAVRMNQSHHQLGMLQQKWEVQSLSQKALTPKPITKRVPQPEKSSVEPHESTPFEEIGLENEKWHPLFTSLEEQHGDCLSLAREDEDAFPQLKSYGSEGNAVAVWLDDKDDHLSEGSFFKASHYNSSTKTWTKPSTLSSQNIFSDNWSILGVDSTGNATMMWVEEEIRVISFQSSTNKWTDAVNIGKAIKPLISFDSDSLGNTTIAWSNYGSSEEVLFNVVNYDAKTQKCSSPISITSDLYHSENGNFRRVAPLAVRCDNHGNASVMCCDRLNGNLFGVVYDSTHEEWSSPELISTGFKDVDELQIVSTGPGQFMGMWVEEKFKYLNLLTNTLHSSAYDSNGKKWSTPIQIFESDQLLEIERLQLQKDALGNVVVVWKQDVNRRSAEAATLYIDEFNEEWLEDLEFDPIAAFFSRLVQSGDMESESIDQFRRLLTEDRPLKIGAATFHQESNIWNQSDLATTLSGNPVLVNIRDRLHVFWEEYCKRSASTNSNTYFEDEYEMTSVSEVYYDPETESWSSPKTIFEFPPNNDPESCSIAVGEDTATIGWLEQDENYHSCNIPIPSLK
ncbi:MAG: hypothetical protein K1000chlam3_01450 [Chlamydiae bacterium]|nr:hypothetical protein [Chlamydiota bacterium]